MLTGARLQSLTSVCDCLSEAVRQKWRASMTFHPPHVHNLVDVQQLANLLLERWEREKRISRVHQEARSPGHWGFNATAARAVRIELQDDLRSGCCCARPPSWRTNASDKVLMWWNPCRVRAAGPS